jgi:transcriptional regulator with XRE-family HTH domain
MDGFRFDGSIGISFAVSGNVSIRDAGLSTLILFFRLAGRLSRPYRFAIVSNLMAGLMSVTLKDVAEAARVSVSTASRALGGGGLASERTQQRLARIARELGYRPNPIARGLKTGQSRLVGLLIHNLANASFQVMAEVVHRRR